MALPSLDQNPREALRVATTSITAIPDSFDHAITASALKYCNESLPTARNLQGFASPGGRNLVRGSACLGEQP